MGLVGQPEQASGLPYAAWGRRTVAFLLDWAPNLLAAVVLGLAYVDFLLTLLHQPDNGVVPARFDTALVLAAVGGGLAVLAMGWTVFDRWRRAGRTGQSVGKRALRLQLVGQQTAAPIGAFQAFVRDLVHILDGLTVVGYLWPLWDERRQTLADMLMNTVVLDLRSAAEPPTRGRVL